ncbi:MAG: hypothetical protein LUF92_00555 [Clostridiales bacterium]|nr:hypothetical protein [Clostridiales bacterium]
MKKKRNLIIIVSFILLVIIIVGVVVLDEKTEYENASKVFTQELQEQVTDIRLDVRNDYLYIIDDEKKIEEVFDLLREIKIKRMEKKKEVEYYEELELRTNTKKIKCGLIGNTLIVDGIMFKTDRSIIRELYDYFVNNCSIIGL